MDSQVTLYVVPRGGVGPWMHIACLDRHREIVAEPSLLGGSLLFRVALIAIFSKAQWDQ